MKKVLLFSMAVCFATIASAQKVYFLYLQTEDFSPFYVRMADKIYSSATSGFLILPNLIDTTYNLNVGFAKSTEPETSFSVPVSQSDRGFLIKKFEDGLGLFDFEDLSVLRSSVLQKGNAGFETKTDNFSNVLSKAAGDPSIIKVPIAKKEDEPKPERKEETVVKIEEQKPVETLVAQDSSTAQKGSSDEPKPLADTTLLVKNDAGADTTTQRAAVEQVPEQKSDSTAQEVSSAIATYKPSVVSRRSESSTTEGFGVIYFDKTEEATDTIRILIPSQKVKLTTDSDSVMSTGLEIEKEKVDSMPQATQNEPVTNAAELQTSSATQSQRMTEGKMTCKNTATERDFLKLRKRMAAEETDEAMIGEAKKDFRSRCYNVEQLRYLSTLFLTSAAKYQFFDAAYEHVSDKGNFSSLGAEIKDDYYAKRFKALVGE